MSKTIIEKAFVHLAPNDNIAVCVKPLEKGQQIRLADNLMTLLSNIEVGHKICIRPIDIGGKIIKHGASIGSALEAIKVGAHVHMHNMKSDYIESNVR